MDRHVDDAVGRGPLSQRRPTDVYTVPGFDPGSHGTPVCINRLKGFYGGVTIC